MGAGKIQQRLGKLIDKFLNFLLPSESILAQTMGRLVKGYHHNSTEKFISNNEIPLFITYVLYSESRKVAYNYILNITETRYR